MHDLLVVVWWEEGDQTIHKLITGQLTPGLRKGKTKRIEIRIHGDRIDIKPEDFESFVHNPAETTGLYLDAAYS